MIIIAAIAIVYRPNRCGALTTLPSPTQLMSTSMYEVFNWGFANEAGSNRVVESTAVTTSSAFRTGKRMHFSIASPQINIDNADPALTIPNHVHHAHHDISSSCNGGSSSSSSSMARRHQKRFSGSDGISAGEQRSRIP